MKTINATSARYRSVGGKANLGAQLLMDDIMKYPDADVIFDTLEMTMEQADRFTANIRALQAQGRHRQAAKRRSA